MSSTTSTEVTKRLRRTFAQEGVPTTLVSDNGPQFVSDETEAWLKNIGCNHVRTPPSTHVQTAWRNGSYGR